jgi:hypothetical protein
MERLLWRGFALPICQSPGTVSRSEISVIPNEFLKFGGQTLITSLIDLFTLISDLETVPGDWQIGKANPLHKSRSMYDLDNHRGIT